MIELTPGDEGPHLLLSLGSFGYIIRLEEKAHPIVKRIQNLPSSATIHKIIIHSRRILKEVDSELNSEQKRQASI